MSSVSSAASPSVATYGVEPRPSLPDQLTHVADALQDCELNARRVGALDTGRRLLGMQRLLEKLRETAKSASDSCRDRAEQLSQRHAYLLNEAVQSAPNTISPPAPAATPPLSTYFPGGQDNVTPLVLAYLPATEERQALVAGDSPASARSQQVLALQHQMRSRLTSAHLNEQTHLLEQANMARAEQNLPPLEPIPVPPPLSSLFRGEHNISFLVVRSLDSENEQNSLIVNELPAHLCALQLQALQHGLQCGDLLANQHHLTAHSVLAEQTSMARAERGLPDLKRIRNLHFLWNVEPNPFERATLPSRPDIERMLLSFRKLSAYEQQAYNTFAWIAAGRPNEKNYKAIRLLRDGGSSNIRIMHEAVKMAQVGRVNRRIADRDRAPAAAAAGPGAAARARQPTDEDLYIG